MSWAESWSAARPSCSLRETARRSSCCLCSRRFLKFSSLFLSMNTCFLGWRSPSWLFSKVHAVPGKPEMIFVSEEKRQPAVKSSQPVPLVTNLCSAPVGCKKSGPVTGATVKEARGREVSQGRRCKMSSHAAERLDWKCCKYRKRVEIIVFTASFVGQLSCSCSAKATPSPCTPRKKDVKPLLMLNLALT